MDKFILVKPETIVKLGQCFSDAEEVKTFLEQMDSLINELTFVSMIIERAYDEDQIEHMIGQQVALFSYFCREHMELIQQLVRQFEATEVTGEELKRIKEEGL